jgi:hypothetical protein
VILTVLSDLHFEFHRDGGRSFTADLLGDDLDLVLLAGDIAVGPGIPDALAILCEHFSRAAVAYVHGNHEFYGATRGEVVDWTTEAAVASPNLYPLERGVVELGGRRILGATLWFGRSPEAERFKLAMNDFRVIRELERWVYDENQRTIAWLEQELREGDIVMTHHLPSQRSVAPQWEHSPLNRFFVCDLEALIVARRPALWVHGHTHCSMDYPLGGTRIVCNPFGYARHEENGGFDPRLRIEI